MLPLVLPHLPLAAVGLSHLYLAAVGHVLAVVGLPHLPLAAVGHVLAAVGLSHLPFAAVGLSHLSLAAVGIPHFSFAAVALYHVAIVAVGPAGAATLGDDPAEAVVPTFPRSDGPTEVVLVVAVSPLKLAHIMMFLLKLPHKHMDGPAEVAPCEMMIAHMEKMKEVLLKLVMTFLKLLDGGPFCSYSPFQLSLPLLPLPLSMDTFFTIKQLFI